MTSQPENAEKVKLDNGSCSPAPLPNGSTGGVSGLALDRIICGDNVETLQTFPDACIDLTVTSPPYDNLRTYGGHSWDFEGVAAELWRVTKPGGVVVWVVADQTKDGSETGTSFRQALRFMDIGFRLYDTMIWDKGVQTTPTEGRYYATWEYVFILSKGKPKAINLIADRPNVTAGSKRTSLKNCRKHKRVYGGKSFVVAETGRRNSIWTINPTCRENQHEAVFPESLARDHILSWSNEGDTVLDPFNGSGTTTKMAREMGRHYIGIEINADYCDIARKRLRQGVLFGTPQPQEQTDANR